MLNRPELEEACINIEKLIFTYIKYLKQNENNFSSDEMDIGQQTLGLLQLQKDVLFYYKKINQNQNLNKEQLTVLQLILLDVQALFDTISLSIGIE